MTLDAALWAHLEDHGLTVTHLEMLLRALETHGNGSIAWHYAHGRLTQVDLRVTCASRRAEVTRVSEGLFGEGNSLLR